MVDQKEKFLEKGLSVNFVGEGQDDDRALDAIVHGQVQLVYISPESLLENKRYRSMLKSRNYQEKMVALVVDEAHCVKFWLVPPVMIVCKFQCKLFRRGDEFRTAFAKSGNIRCLLPEKVNVLALTATATKETLECVICRLAMYQPIIIGLPPDRPNIKLIVKPYLSIPTLCQQLSDELKEKRSLFPKTVIFCRSLKHCADMCEFMRRFLGPHITDPSGQPSILQFRLVDVFTAASDNDMREEVLKEFSKKILN